jgi:hypothetical protein
VNLPVIAVGAGCGLGAALLVSELLPGVPRLDAALARLAGPDAVAGRDSAAGTPPAAAASPGPAARRIASAGAWRLIPVPAADLALLGQSRENWIVIKAGLGLAGLAVPPGLAALASAVGTVIPATLPAAASLACGCLLFFVPDLVTRSRAARCRADFRHALTSYLDLVALARGAGAGPTEALETAAEIGHGWEFRRIAAALAGARRAGAAPWTALARLARELGVTELSDIADIAEVAGQEGARVMDTLVARAASLRVHALADERARAGARSTTMVIPVALLGAGFLILLIFPVIYRTIGAA